MVHKNIKHITKGCEKMNFEKEIAVRKQRIFNQAIPDTTNYTVNNIAEGEILFYKEDDKDINVSVLYKDDTFWMTQKAMAELFDCSSDNISLHLKNIYKDEELIQEATTELFSLVQKEGNRNVRRNAKCYNLDAIIAVGYRVNSKKATKFRQWATATLKEFITKGFVINDDMLKNGNPFGKDYFDELLEKIKEIRASERRFYQKITDIYAQCSYDYDPNSAITKNFFKNVQNKLLFAVTGQTAPEIIHSRADSHKDHMGLTSWKNSPDGKILKSDTIVSKNYLNQTELSDLNDIVNMYLDYAENQAKRNKLMSMQDWISKLDAFLQFNEYDILHNFGTVTRQIANALAYHEYEKYRVIQDKEYVSDFDKEMHKYLK